MYFHIVKCTTHRCVFILHFETKQSRKTFCIVCALINKRSTFYFSFCREYFFAKKKEAENTGCKLNKVWAVYSKAQNKENIYCSLAH